ncbi:MAG: DUF3135 domain-containing protein [Rhodoferax sp.]
MDNFNFDYWKELAATSAVEFEIQRRQVLQEFANKAPAEKQSALHALVDTLCVPQHGSPMERAANAQTLLSESLSYLHTGWSDIGLAAQQVSPTARALMDGCTDLVQSKSKKTI